MLKLWRTTSDAQEQLGVPTFENPVSPPIDHVQLVRVELCRTQSCRKRADAGGHEIFPSGMGKDGIILCPFLGNLGTNDGIETFHSFRFRLVPFDGQRTLELLFLDAIPHVRRTIMVARTEQSSSVQAMVQGPRNFGRLFPVHVDVVGDKTQTTSGIEGKRKGIDRPGRGTVKKLARSPGCHVVGHRLA